MNRIWRTNVNISTGEHGWCISPDIHLWYYNIMLSLTSDRSWWKILQVTSAYHIANFQGPSSTRKAGNRKEADRKKLETKMLHQWKLFPPETSPLSPAVASPSYVFDFRFSCRLHTFYLSLFKRPLQSLVQHNKQGVQISLIVYMGGGGGVSVLNEFFS